VAIFVKVIQASNGSSFDNTPQIEWQKCYGGKKDDYANCIRKTVDGGYIIAGSTNSTDNDVTVNYGLSDFGLLKLI